MAKLIAKGAEADLWLDLDWYGLEVVIKVRGEKKYRHPKLDREIRRARTIQEASLLHRVKGAGVTTPLVYHVDPENAKIVMEYVRGKRVRDIVDSLSEEERITLFKTIGRTTGLMHGSNVIHGDLTTSNMIKTDGRVVFIDFGLGEVSMEVEKRGVDLNLLKRMLTSTHYMYTEELFKAFKDGYRDSMGDMADMVLERIKEIEQRGRYIERDMAHNR
jgi:Kae1-associated kinase Bud32